MKELLYKELSMQRGIMKKNIQSIVIIILLNAWFFYCGTQSISLTMGIYCVVLLSLNIIVNSITMEKTNKMFEKMLTMYRVDKIIGAKLITSIIISSIAGCVFSIGNRILLVILKNQKFDVKIQLLELFIIIGLSVLFSFLCGTVFLFIDNAQIGSYIIMPVMVGAMLLGVFINEIKVWHLVVIGIVIVIVSAILYKILGLVKPDRLTKE